jgi:signal transduction histidine kinase
MDTDLIESQGLISALKYEADLIQKAGIYNIVISIEGDPVYMESSKELLIFRMIQEACNNIIKHADANQIRIMLNYANDHLRILVCDNGKGFDTQIVFENASQKRSSGLRNIKNRASLIDATVDIQSNSTTGTKLEILIPINTGHENR